MIHRFVDLPNPPRIPCTGLPYTVSLFDDGYFVFKCAERISPGDFEEMNNVVLSPDAKTVAYNINFPGPNGEGEIRTQPPTGGAATTISAPDAGGPWFLHPSWGPDSDRLVYIHADPAKGFYGSIVETLLSSAGTETVLYTPSTVGFPGGWGPFRPQYSPDGTKIAFILKANGGSTANAGLYVMDSDGSNVTQIDAFTNGYGFDGSQFGWAHSSNTIVYANAAGGIAADVYLINADGTGKTKLNTGTDTSGASGWPHVSNRCWAEDDSFVVISCRFFDGSSFVFRPYRLEIDGSGETQLNSSHGPDGDANFRCVYIHPEDNRIYFVEQANSSLGSIASVAIDGTDYRVDHDITTIPQSVAPSFSNGTGIEWN